MRLTQTSDLWWKNAVVYCLDVETYADGNGDGCGDFRGLIQNIDHLARLGVRKGDSVVLMLGNHALVTDFGVAKALSAALPHSGTTSAGIARASARCRRLASVVRTSAKASYT